MPTSCSSVDRSSLSSLSLVLSRSFCADDVIHVLGVVEPLMTHVAGPYTDAAVMAKIHTEMETSLRKRLHEIADECKHKGVSIQELYFCLLLFLFCACAVDHSTFYLMPVCAVPIRGSSRKRRCKGGDHGSDQIVFRRFGHYGTSLQCSR